MDRASLPGMRADTSIVEGERHGHVERARDLETGHARARHQDRGRSRHPRGTARALRRVRGQGEPRCHRGALGSTPGPLRGGHRHHPDPARRGQDDDDPRARPGHAPHLQARHHRHPPSLDGPDLRDQGRRRRRRLQPGRALRGAQPPPHRRHARGDRRAQHPVRHARQPPPSRQRARHRPPQHHVASGARRQRPGPAQPRRRPRHRRGRGARARPASTSPPRPRSWRCSPCRRSLRDMRDRLGRIVVGYTRERRPGHRRGAARRRGP